MTISANYPSIRPTLLLDFANGEALDSRITFSRPTTGTYYDGKTSAVAEQNLILNSQTIGGTSWSVFNSLTINTNNAAAPDANTTATLVTSSSGTKQTVFQILTGTSGLVYVVSLYGKAGTNNWLFIENPTTGTPAVWFNLSTGAVGTVATGSASIVSAGSGWYRCILTITVSSTTLVPSFGLSNADNTTSQTSGQTAFVWGAQVEQRSTVTALTPTTTQAITNYIPVLLTAAAGVARFQHNPTTGESLGLLIEEQRTNLATYSEQFDDASWTKVNATITPNTIVSPNGTISGDTITTTTTGGYVTRSGLTVANSTLSVYVKQGVGTRFSLGTNAASNDDFAIFNLGTGTVVSTGANNVAASITSVGNGWYRLVVTRGATAGTQIFIGFLTSGATANDYHYIWGAQLEAGAFPTSYIPTVASQVIRSSDQASMTGTNFSSWYNIAEGTLYAEGIGSVTSSAVATLINICDSSEGQTERNQLRLRSVGASYVYSANAVVQASITNGAYASTGNKVASVYKVNDFAVSNNSTAVGTDTLGSVGAPVEARFGRLGVIEYLNGTIKKIAYYPIRVTDAQLQALTGS